MPGPAVCRLNDVGLGVCPGHPIPVPFVVTITLASPTVLSTGFGVANLTSIGVATCGHTTVATMGSSTVKANGAGVHRLGDVGLTQAGGTYAMTLGSPTVFAGT